MIGQTISHFKILEKLGEGGMGEVYKAEDTKLHRLVAIKVLPPQALVSEQDKIRFAHEAQAAASLNHPNIAMIFEFDEIDGQAFIAMEYVEGETLKGKIRERPLPVNDAVNIAIAVAEGLTKAHEKGIIHRDIKSDNVMISRDGVVKIMDFGLAEIAGRSRVTKEGMTVGTAAYMSPEQARGEKLDQRTDIWSLGVVLYEMVTGRFPFPGEYEQAIVYQILNEEPEPITSLRSNVPMELERIAKKAMQKDRANRYQHVDEMLTDLKSHRKEIESGEAKEQLAKAAIRKEKQTYLYWGVAALVAVLLVAGLYLFRGRSKTIDSIAVLPLENLSADPEQEYFADGMTDALIANLGRISSLRVTSRTSVMQYKKARKPLPEIARELNVDAVIEGSVLRSGDRVRITAQLIHAPTDRHLWAQSYDRDVRNILTLQSEVARTIAEEIHIKLTPRQQASLARIGVVNSQSHEAYLKGTYHYNRGRLETAMDYFKQAIELDPNYAPAYAGLARCYYFLGLFGVLPANEAFPKMKETASRALEKDETLPEAHSYLALAILHHDWNWVEAEREFKRALDLNPSQADIHHDYAHYLMSVGRGEESLAESKRATELDPLSLFLTSCLGWHRLFAQQYDWSIEQSLKVLQMDPEFIWAHMILGWAYEQKSMFDKAITEFQNSITLSQGGVLAFAALGEKLARGRCGVVLSGGDVLAMAALGHAFAVSGKRQEALEVLAKLNERLKRSYVSAYDIATVHAGLGDKDQTFEWLTKAYEERSSWLVHINWDPRFASLHSDPRFATLLKKIGLEK